MPNQTQLANVNTSEAGHPIGYRIDEIILTNFEGETVDISPLVTDFSILESLYAHSLILSLNIKDPVNLFEEYNISGQEKIEVKLSREDLESGKEVNVSHTFYCVEYPTYAKFPNRLQTYTFQGVSIHSFLNKFKKVSFSYNDSIANIIKDILTFYCAYPEDDFTKTEKATAVINTIIPGLHPLDAISWLLHNAFDEDGAPFYCFETLAGKLYLKSQAELVDSVDPHRVYYDGKFYLTDRPKERYEEVLSRILSISSNIQMSKFLTGASGAYSSESTYLDLSTKSHSISKFTHLGDGVKIHRLNPNLAVSEEFEIENNKLRDFNETVSHMIPLNELAHENAKNIYSALQGNKVNIGVAHKEGLEEYIHDITVAGDLTLEVGKVVDLRLQKSIDPQVNVPDSKTDGEIDKKLSGKYLITSLTHKFSNEGYYCEMRVKKDSVL